MPVYKQYDQSTLDKQYNNRLHVPDFATHLDRWELLSRKTEKEFYVIKELPYGSLPREKLDIYPSLQPSSKTLIFIHGGYWHKLGKEDFQFIARAFRAHGVTTVLMNYPLAPEVSMDQIVASCREAIRWVSQNIANYNGDPDQLYITGYSAGAHLATMLLATDWKHFNINKDLIKGVCTISGMFDLIPILLSDINQVLVMDKETAIRNSPIRLVPQAHCPIVIAVGSDETDEFLDQSLELYLSWKKTIPAEMVELRGVNHYSIVETIMDPESLLHRAMLRLLKL